MEGEDLHGWSQKQGFILTGGGVLNDCSTEGRDFDASDLPHFHLTNRSTRRVFQEWLTTNRRSFSIVGCWSRPLFSGGFDEDTMAETEAFNLQTPSMFIDMRFPRARPTYALRERGSVQSCSDEELRWLARQHCFSGYSLPSQALEYLYFTRHHIIDWNYHPTFPRPRPNKWWVQLDNEGDWGVRSDMPCQSFKEFSFARDKYDVPVYFERWARINGDGNGAKYLAARRKVECPFEAAKQGRKPKRDAVFIIMGNHFAVAIDRPVPLPLFEGSQGPGGPALVDYALDHGLRQDAERYLDLEGSYGKVDEWEIQKSTHPWREGQRFISPDQEITLHLRSKESSHNEASLVESLYFHGFEWTVLECSYTAADLVSLLQSPGSRVRTIPSHEVSKL